MKAPFLRFQEQPSRVAVVGMLIFIGALALPVLGNQLMGVPDFMLLSPAQLMGMLCINLWVILAPLGLMMITCGLLGEYCRLRQKFNRPD